MYMQSISLFPESQSCVLFVVPVEGPVPSSAIPYKDTVPACRGSLLAWGLHYCSCSTSSGFVDRWPLSVNACRVVRAFDHPRTSITRASIRPHVSRHWLVIRPVLRRIYRIRREILFEQGINTTAKRLKITTARSAHPIAAPRLDVSTMSVVKASSAKILDMRTIRTIRTALRFALVTLGSRALLRMSDPPVCGLAVRGNILVSWVYAFFPRLTGPICKTDCHVRRHPHRRSLRYQVWESSPPSSAGQGVYVELRSTSV